MFKFNLKVILYVIGILLAFNGGLMLVAALISLLMKDGVSFEITLSAFTVMGMGASMVLVFRNHHANIQTTLGLLRSEYALRKTTKSMKNILSKFSLLRCRVDRLLPY